MKLVKMSYIIRKEKANNISNVKQTKE